MGSELVDIAKTALLPAAITLSSALMFNNDGTYKAILGMGAMMFFAAAWGRYSSEAAQRPYASVRRE